MTAHLQELVSIQSAPAKLTANFEEIDKALSEHLEQYNTVVTADGVKDAKATATEINKLKQTIETRRKDAVSEVSAPIRQFEEQMKALSGRCEDARQSILGQVQKFEDETRDLCRELLEHRLGRLWDEYGVNEYHARARVGDLVKISNVTAKGNLTQAAIDSVNARVAEDRARQDKVERRILELENRSYKSGLSAPLTRDHVHQWLESDDDTYESQIQRILDAEVQREEQAQARIRERLEREQREKDAREQARRERAEMAAPAEESETNAVDYEIREEEKWSVKASTERPKTGNVHVSVLARFELDVPAHVTDFQLRNELINKMNSAGFKSVPEIVITRDDS